MVAYPKDYLSDVVENQGKLFDLGFITNPKNGRVKALSKACLDRTYYVAYTYPNCDTEDFIKSYMTSKTRKSIDQAMAYVNTMDAKELWDYFCKTENYTLKAGHALEGFLPDWIGEFYAYYQWYNNIPSAEVINKVPLDYLKKAYPGLHDLDLELAVKKVS